MDIDYDEEIDGTIPIMVTVEEDRTTRFYPIIDYDRRWDVLLGARVYDINFRGRGEDAVPVGDLVPPPRLRPGLAASLAVRGARL